MDQKIYLAFLNDHFFASRNAIAGDLQRCLPFPFESMAPGVDLKLFFSAERKQYHSTLILAHILSLIPEDGTKIVGITNVDIYIPILTFLFGEAQLGGKGAIVSSFRLRNPFYGLPEDKALQHNRLVKEILHELGHTLGLIHCPNYECVMHSSTYVEDIDLKRDQFCPNCQDALKIRCEER